jgi:hypothetical protein
VCCPKPIAALWRRGGEADKVPWLGLVFHKGVWVSGTAWLERKERWREERAVLRPCIFETASVSKLLADLSNTQTHTQNNTHTMEIHTQTNRSMHSYRL